MLYFTKNEDDKHNTISKYDPEVDYVNKDLRF